MRCIWGGRLCRNMGCMGKEEGDVGGKKHGFLTRVFLVLHVRLAAGYF